VLPSAHDSATDELERDATLAHETLSAQIALLSRRASTQARLLGDAVRLHYREALASKGEPSPSAWHRFVASLWDFMRELDSFTPERSPQSNEARGALDRILFENLDLLE